MSLIVAFLAAVCFAIVALLGFGVFHGAHILGWLGLGLIALTAFIALVGPVVALRSN